MNENKYILVVDDEVDITGLLEDILSDQKYIVFTAANAIEANKIYDNQHIDLVLLDIWMPETDGITLLTEWVKQGLKSSVIMMSGHGNIETAVQSTKLGAFDFIEKPISIAKMLISIQNCFKHISLEKKNEALLKQFTPYSNVVGNSTPILNIKTQLQSIANKDMPVILQGDSGTGKSFYARYLHQISPYKNEAFIAINASALSRTNQAEEIFGNNYQQGLIHTAQNGTLFIDEITDLDLATQAVFSQIISEGHYKQSGVEQLTIPNVRLCFGAENEPYQSLTDGMISDDFYYRVSAMIITLPSLNQVVDDIENLVTYFINDFVDKEQLDEKVFSYEAMDYIKKHSWQGNMRELKNFVQRALVLCKESVIGLQDVKLLLDIKPKNYSGYNPVALDLSLREAREEFEKTYFIKQFELCDGNVAKLSERSGMERTNLYRKLKSLGINYK